MYGIKWGIADIAYPENGQHRPWITWVKTMYINRNRKKNGKDEIRAVDGTSFWLYIGIRLEKASNAFMFGHKASFRMGNMMTEKSIGSSKDSLLLTETFQQRSYHIWNEEDWNDVIVWRLIDLSRWRGFLPVYRITIKANSKSRLRTEIFFFRSKAPWICGGIDSGIVTVPALPTSALNWTHIARVERNANQNEDGSLSLSLPKALSLSNANSRRHDSNRLYMQSPPPSSLWKVLIGRTRGWRGGTNFSFRYKNNTKKNMICFVS